MKFLCHVVPRRGAEEACAQQVASLGRSLRAQQGGKNLNIQWLERIPNDAFGPKTPFHTTLDIRGDTATPEQLAELLGGLGERIAEVAHPEHSTSLAGHDVVFIAPHPSATVRYQYLMRRKARFTHAAYLKRYQEIHSQFGLRTPGIRGYVQFHVDLEASERVAHAAGLGVCDVDSVSELYLVSQQIFLDQVSVSSVGPEAIADEEHFVERSLSVDFCSHCEVA